VREEQASSLQRPAREIRRQRLVTAGARVLRLVREYRAGIADLERDPGLRVVADECLELGQPAQCMLFSVAALNDGESRGEVLTPAALSPRSRRVALGGVTRPQKPPPPRLEPPASDGAISCPGLLALMAPVLGSKLRLFPLGESRTVSQ
jgi:hypothetical protein